jgi:predicted unusual protein kinase regulating ubiquinone biosynthesis (AarF/ABC1/UbiB family)
MVSYVEAPQRYSIIEAVVHLVNRDFVSLAELYRRMGFIPQDGKPRDEMR